MYPPTQNHSIIGIKRSPIYPLITNYSGIQNHIFIPQLLINPHQLTTLSLLLTLKHCYLADSKYHLFTTNIPTTIVFLYIHLIMLSLLITLQPYPQILKYSTSPWWLDVNSHQLDTPVDSFKQIDKLSIIVKCQLTGHAAGHAQWTDTYMTVGAWI